MYLVDGNNLAGRRSNSFSESERRDLLTLLAQFVRLRKVRLTVVFDGNPDRHFPDGMSFQGVKITYARSGSTADFRIRNLLEQHPTPRECTVVTNDRELRMGARVRQAKVISCSEFRSQLDALIDKAPAGTEPKPVTKSEEVGQWMRYFGVDPNDDPESEEEISFEKSVGVTRTGVRQHSRPQPGKGKK
ncbi:MAG: NYN domain-containing protein [Blastocatellia bacterium]|nr:NYN domain-containing protein [Blastocatellia bacterium]